MHLGERILGASVSCTGSGLHAPVNATKVKTISILEQTAWSRAATFQRKRCERKRRLAFHAAQG
jgi:hypothetical protein